MRIGIYGPYFGIMGGGELYLGTIAEVLSRDYQVDLVSESDISPTAFQKFFGLDLSLVQIRKIPQIPFVESLNPLFPERTEQYLQNTRFTQEYDVFIIMPRNFRIPFRTLSKRSILHLQVPDRPWQFQDYFKALTSGKFSELRNEIVKAFRYPSRYAQFDAVVINSRFHQDIISKRLVNPHAIVLHPPVMLRQPRDWDQKQKTILAVGRFFRGLHSKRQDVLVDAFRSFSKQAPEWKFVLAGGLSDEPSARDYSERLRQSAEGLPIEFRTNVAASELDELFSSSRFFWHAAGFEVPKTAPEKMEHFGIATVEAMSTGCIPLAYRAGGQEEIINDGTNGFFWTSKSELVERTLSLVNNDQQCEKISRAAIERSKEFGKDRFAEKLLTLVGSFF
ncbi:glycosyltransferase family 4 protein [bacterium]|nr:glycosyltransferase family 4 protein [bacterium]